MGQEGVETMEEREIGLAMVGMDMKSMKQHLLEQRTLAVTMSTPMLLSQAIEMSSPSVEYMSLPKGLIIDLKV